MAGGPGCSPLDGGAYPPASDSRLAPARYSEFGGYWQNSVRAGYTDPNWIYTTNTNTPQNPVALLELKDDTAKSQSAIGNIEFDYKIHGFEDLHIHANVGGDYSEGRQTTVISPYSYSNNYYGWDGIGQSYKYNLQGNIYAQYIKEIGVHNIDVLIAAEEQHFNRKEYSEGQGWDPYAKVAKSPSLRSETEHIYTNTLVSYFGRVNYSLLDRYLLTATMRFDGSSRFSKDNRWGQFPAVGLAWKISEEKLLRNCNALDELKLRLGWGITGQQNIGYDFYYLPRYVTSNQYAQYTIGDKTYYTLRPEVYNSDLKWEKTTTYNAGLDWSFLKGRIDGSVEYYYRKTTDLISSVSVAAGTNFGNYLVKNIGSLRNYGIEASINARPIVTKDFTWQINYNVTWNDNKITKLTTGSDYALTGDDISAGLSNKVQVNKVGYPANSFYVYQQVYDEEGRPIEGLFVDRDGNGTIDPNDKYVYKKPTGDVTMGLTSKFIWKAWDFSFALRASFNNYLYYDFLSNKANVSWSGVYSNSAYNNTYADAVALGFQGKTNYYMSDYFIRNATFLRCDNINLGYSFNNLFRGTSYHGLSGRIYATVSNPFVITKYDGIDPERASGLRSSTISFTITKFSWISFSTSEFSNTAVSILRQLVHPNPEKSTNTGIECSSA